MMRRTFALLATMVAALWLLASSAAIASGKPDAVLPNGASYFGPLKNGLMEGRGRLVAPYGLHYTGDFHAGVMAGHGDLELGNGDHYTGQMADGWPNGHGVLVFGSGARYEGNFADGYPEGEGRLTDVDGSVYIGAFHKGRPDGEGHLTRPGGMDYHGQLKNGRFDGSGVLHTGHGDTYKGTFAVGQIVEGEWTGAQGRHYRGQFSHWRFNGKGVYYGARGWVIEGRFADGSAISGRWHDKQGDRYAGGFKDMRFSGPGTFTTADGDVYTGTFKDGSLGGPGRYEGADGTRYRGEFENWRFSGKGRLDLPDGDVYIGHFRHGDYNGPGKLTTTAADGKPAAVESGVWIDGELKGDTWHDRAVQVAAQALYRQPHLLDAELNALQPRTQGKINLYFVGVAGNGTQEVFRREVEYVARQFDDRFGTKGHTAVLANSRTSAARLPMATLQSLRQTLAAVAQRMDPDRDILFLFLTSHGGHDQRFSLDEYGIQLADLKAPELAKMLSDLPFRYKVVVISACYSGGFIPSLTDGHTLVMTAARADRTSFGCADDNDFTYFGEAFFKDSVPKTDSFVSAFESARHLVSAWENRDKEQHSDPQIHREPSVEAQLRSWRKQLRTAKSVASTQ